MIILKITTGCSWMVKLRDVKGTVCLDQGWPGFSIAHQINIGYLMTFKMMRGDVFKATIFDYTMTDVVQGNFRKEKLEFEVVDWESQYHAILDRPMFAKFMAVPHYAYLKLKIPGNNGTIITVHESFSRSDNCDRDFQKIASKFGIKLKKEDQELTAFITPHGVYCYNVMTFGLKNAGATYQRCMQAYLGEQIGRNIEVYIDDIIVKTRNAATLIDDLRETFDNLDRYKIKLNPKKCFFGVPGGQVLGFFISARGIEANPLKIKAVLDMEPPKSVQQVQQLAGRLAALSRFIAKLREKALPFYPLMKKPEKFEWIAEAQDAFDNLKKVLSTSPVLETPQDREPMLLYIAATIQVVSTVLVVERAEEGKVHGVQRPVYYLSEVLMSTHASIPLDSVGPPRAEVCRTATSFP
ncbi:hypothetical protein QYE76_002431 [Lolium multiflorum]|uniref:TF-B3 domain-containing protein n=1 Tax=Lolium multiflorum TaxID=4521 RepID=A0AAD8RLN9_LOLMU|nr:hypothetical protein QYE76_002431 [Lolium multiflorum]